MNHPTLADRLIYGIASLIVVALYAVAAVISYSHLLELALGHGQAGLNAHLTPLVIDGLVIVPSLVLLAAARRRHSPPVLAHFAHGLGIAATLAANVIYGIEWGLLGAAIAGAPAVTLVLTQYLLTWLIRRAGAVSQAPVGDGMDAHVADALALVAVRPVPVAAARPVLADLPPVELPVVPERQEVAERPAPVGSVAVEWVAPPLPVAVKEEVAPVAAAADPKLAPKVATAREVFAEVLATGGLPSVRQVRAKLNVGHPNATRIREALTV